MWVILKILSTKNSVHFDGMLARKVNNAYLNAPCREKIWFDCGTECSENTKNFVWLEKQWSRMEADDM